jgi:nitrogen fixation NifU-like protein
MNLEAMYQEIILDHYKNPQNKNLSEPCPAGFVQVHHVNPTCGDEISLRIKVEQSQIVSLEWDGLGCSISQASASIMSQLVVHQQVPDALDQIDLFLKLMKSDTSVSYEELDDAIAFAGVAKYPARIKCALLGWMALKDSIAQSMEGKDK